MSVREAGVGQNAGLLDPSVEQGANFIAKIVACNETFLLCLQMDE